jgi:hypothetical protein
MTHLYTSDSRRRPARHTIRAALWGAALCVAVAGSAPLAAATIYANPGDNITTKVNTMSPGDTLILNPGTYSSTIRIFNLNGDSDHWFTLRGSDAGTARIVATGFNNMVETYNSSYWRIENLDIDGRNLAGARTASDGIKGKVNTDSDNDYYHHFVFENLYVHHVYNNCFSSHVTGWDILIRNCHFSDAQEVGLYMGNSNGYQPIMNFTFDHNLVERTGNYNMEVKAQLPRVGVGLGTTPGLEFTTWGYLIKDNVWMRDNETVDANRPNFLIDAAPMSGPGINDVATIEGNVVLGNATNTYVEAGFQLAGNLIVRNNIIMHIEGSGYAGIRIGAHQGISPRHLELVNNTVFLLAGSTDARCLSLFNLLASNPGQDPYPQIVANNAFIRGNTAATAVSRDGSGSVTYANNYIRGQGSLPGSISLNGYALGDIFINPVETPGLANLYPVGGSPLINAGSNTYATAYDFNRISRPKGAAADVGAYEVSGPTNPGWQLAIDFKKIYGDVNLDGAVDAADLLLVADSFGLSTGNPGFDSRCDFNNSGTVDISDVLILAGTFGT